MKKIKKIFLKTILFLLRRGKRDIVISIPENAKIYGKKGEQSIVCPIDNDGPFVLKQLVISNQKEFTELYRFPRLALKLILELIKEFPVDISYEEIHGVKLGNLVSNKFKYAVEDFDAKNFPIGERADYAKSLVK